MFKKLIRAVQDFKGSKSLTLIGLKKTKLPQDSLEEEPVKIDLHPPPSEYEYGSYYEETE